MSHLNPKNPIVVLSCSPRCSHVYLADYCVICCTSFYWCERKDYLFTHAPDGIDGVKCYRCKSQVKQITNVRPTVARPNLVYLALQPPTGL